MKFGLKVLIFSALAISGFMIATGSALGATLYLVSGKGSVGIGEEILVDVKIDADEEFINAAQATIQFPVNILQALSIDKVSSAFNFWVEEPFFDNSSGVITFIGGTAKGISGKALQVLKIKMKSVGAGSAALDLQNAVVTASDGKGTNVLSTIQGASIAVGSKVVQQPPQISPTEQPQKITREPAQASGLPLQPKVRAPLYPDPMRWYNHVGDTVVLWDVPADVSAIAFKVDKNPNTDPQATEEDLYTGKSIGILKEGIWYVHVQFKNNIGWGKIAHYRIAIDTTAPLPFEAKIDREVSDNPRPKIAYETQDALSGIKEAIIMVDGVEAKRGSERPIEIGPIAPGKHSLEARIFDAAGNSVADGFEFEILPLPNPTVDFITNAISYADHIFASGKTIPDTFIDLKIVDRSDRIIFSKEFASDSAGNWQSEIEDLIATGKYKFQVTARDERGALSYPSEPLTLRVKSKIIISLGFADLGWFEIFIILLLVVIAGASLTGWYYMSEKKTREAYSVIVGRDIDKLSTLLESRLKDLESLEEVHDASAKARADSVVKQMAGIISRMRKYLSQEVEKID